MSFARTGNCGSILEEDFARMQFEQMERSRWCAESLSRRPVHICFLRWFKTSHRQPEQEKEKAFSWTAFTRLNFTHELRVPDYPLLLPALLVLSPRPSLLNHRRLEPST